MAKLIRYCCSLVIVLATSGCTTDQVTEIEIPRSAADANGKAVSTARIPLGVDYPASVASVRTSCGCLQVRTEDVVDVHGQAVAIVQCTYFGLKPHGDRQRAYLEVQGREVTASKHFDVFYAPRDSQRYLSAMSSFVPSDEWTLLTFRDFDPSNGSVSKPLLLSDPEDVRAQGAELEVVDRESGAADELGVKIRPQKDPSSIAINFRLANHEVVTAHVFAEGLRGRVQPAKFISRPGKTVSLSVSGKIKEASCSDPNVVTRHDVTEVTVTFPADVTATKGSLSLVVHDEASPLEVKYALVGHVGGQLPSQSHSIDSSNDNISSAPPRILEILSMLEVNRASYKLRHRRMIISGSVIDESIDRLIDEFLNSNQRSLSTAWWDWWTRKSADTRATVSKSDETYEVACQPGVFKKRYIDFMPGVELTERPLAELYTAQSLMRLTSDKRLGVVVHLQQRLAYLLQDTNTILSPIPSAPQQLRAIKLWQKTIERRGSFSVTRFVDEAASHSSYSFWISRGSATPSAARLQTGQSDFVAVYDWQNRNGFEFVSNVGKVHIAGNQCVVDWLSVDDIQFSPKSQDVVLRTVEPRYTLDHRTGNADYKDFSYEDLPADVRDCYVVR